MYTLQILDDGQTFLHTLDSRRLTLGSGERDGVRLHEDGVVPEHACFVPDGDGLRVEARAAVRVNGDEVRGATPLQLGDRVELGRAVVVVGRTVARKARPEDVLRSALPRVDSRRPRVHAPHRRSWWLPTLVVAAAVAVILVMVSLRDDSIQVRGLVAGVDRLWQEGRVADAEVEAARLRRLWRGAEDARLEQLGEAERRIAAVYAERDRLQAEVLDPAVERGYAEWSDTLQAVEADDDAVARVAARKVRSRLAALLRQRDATRESAGAVVAAERSDAVSDDAPANGGRAPADRGGAPAARRALSGGGVAGESRAMAEQPGAAPAAAASKPQEPQQQQEAKEPQQPQGPSLATLAELRQHMERIRVAESAGAFAEAGRLLAQAAAALAERDADYARRLQVRADEAGHLDAFHRAVVAAVVEQGAVAVVDERGEQFEVRAGEGDVPLLLRSSRGDEALVWPDLDTDVLVALVARLRLEGDAVLGVASLLGRQGGHAAAEQMLVPLWQRHEELRKAIDGVLARGRGEPGDTTYVLQGDSFVSRRSIEIAARSQKLARSLTAALRKSADDRDAFVAAAATGDPLDAEALAMALRRELGERIEAITRQPLQKQVERMLIERVRLEQARDHARELIFDTVRYFYPYKPPAVSSERFAEYNRVQAEVNARVDGLRSVWNGSRLRLKVPKRLGDDLAIVAWLSGQVARFDGFAAGESVESVLAPIGWARALEPGTTTSLQDFCRTPAEREERRRWRRVQRYNEAMAPKLSAAVKSQLAITNDYRMMFGHRPLAIVVAICTAAQGHADEMSMLGYFAHESPTPGRRTPSDRMRLAGYPFGASENIALTGGAQAAHDAWCRSSGHHRNLLMPGHLEAGIGANGRYWVQNFSSGNAHEDSPEWAAAGN